MSSSNNDIVWGRWFSFPEFKAKDIIPKLLQPGQFEALLAQQLKVPFQELLPNPKSIVKTSIIGMKFGLTNQLHCFQVNYCKGVLGVDCQISYLLPKNLTRELFARIDSLFNLEVISNKKVLVIGLGAIGSEVLKELAASSIRHFTVIDDEKFDAGNCVRHAADLLNVGESKALIAKKIIEGRNPEAKVTAIHNSVLKIDPTTLNDILDQHDVVLDLTANKLVEGYLNRTVCVAKKKPLIQAAVSKGGLTGIVIVIIPGKSACLKCLSEQNLNYLPISNLDSEILKNAPPDFGACSQPALPASGIDTREVALQTSRVTLQLLLGETEVFYPKLSGFQYYWHGPSGSKGHKPFEWEVQRSPGLAKCELCNPR